MRDSASKDAIREFQHAAMTKLTDLIELDPVYLDRFKKNKRNPEDAEIVKAFQKAMATDVNNINKVFIGYVRTGSLISSQAKRLVINRIYLTSLLQNTLMSIWNLYLTISTKNTTRFNLHFLTGSFVRIRLGETGLIR